MATKKTTKTKAKAAPKKKKVAAAKPAPKAPEPTPVEAEAVTVSEDTGAGEAAPDKWDTLADYQVPNVDMDGNPVSMDFTGEARLVLETVRSQINIVGVMDNLTPEDVLTVHAYFKAMSGVVKEGTDSVRDAAIQLAKDAGGTADTKAGKITHSWVQPEDAVEYTDETVALLESKGLLEKVSGISVTLKEGLTAADVPDELIDQMKDLFDMELDLDPVSLNAQVTGGHLAAEELEATVNRTEAKGHDRLNVTPAKALKAEFEI